MSVGSLSYPLLSGIVYSRYPSSVLSFAPLPWALSFDIIDFHLSKSMACGIKDFQKLLSDLLKRFEKGEHPMKDCFVERRFQRILSIAAFKVGLGIMDNTD